MLEIIKRAMDKETKLGKLIMFVRMRIEEAQLKQVASTLTLTTLLSIVPALAVIMAAFATFPFFAPYRESFEAFLFSTLLPDQYNEQIVGYMKNFAEKAAGLTIFGVVGLAVSALLCISTIDAGLNRTFQVKKLRQIWNRFLLYWALLTLGPIVLSLSLAFSSYITGMALTGHLSELGQWLYPLIQLVFQGFLLAVLYKYVPNCRVNWKDALVGGMVMAIIMSIFRWGFSIYVMRGSYTSIYGAFAAIPVLLTWMYINWMLVLAGAALTATLPMLRADRYGDFSKVGNDLLSAVEMLKHLMLAKESGNPNMTDVEIADAVGSYPEAVELTLSRLVDRHYIVKVPDAKTVSWALLADADKTSLRGVFEEFCVDTSNSLLSADQQEKKWLWSGLNEAWLSRPMSQVFAEDPMVKARTDSLDEQIEFESSIQRVTAQIKETPK